MPAFMFDLDELETTTIEVDGVVVPTGIVNLGEAWIRRYGGDPVRFSRSGTMFDEAVFVAPSVQMSALTEMFGLSVDARIAARRVGDTLVQVQVSLDGGATYLAWGGGAWAEAAVDGVYNTVGEFNDHCGVFEIINPRQIGFRIKLLRDQATDETPVLRSFGTLVEWSYDHDVEIASWIKSIVTERLRLQVLRAVTLQAAAAQFVLNDEYTIDSTRQISVFHATNDPLMNSDLFNGFNPVTRVVSLTAAQAAGSRLLVKFFGYCDVIVCRQDELVNVTKLPKTVVRIDTEFMQGRNCGKITERKNGDTLKLTRTRNHPVLIEHPVRIEHWTQNEREARAAVAPVASVFSTDTRFHATGERLSVFQVDPGRIAHSLLESFHYATWRGSVRTFLHASSFIEAKQLQTIQINVGEAFDDWPDDVVEVTE